MDFKSLQLNILQKKANEQYGLEYSIARPFNCVGIGEIKAINSDENSKKLTLSHVVPDLILKTMMADDSIEILGMETKYVTIHTVKTLQRVL